MQSTETAEIVGGPIRPGAMKAPRTSRWSWQACLAVGASVAGAAAVLLHLIGNAVHRAYLFQWGIDSGPFAKTSEWLTTQGYYGVWSALGTALVALFAHWYWVSLAVIAMLIYFLLLVMPWNPFDGEWTSRFARWPKWLRWALGIVSAGPLTTLMLWSSTVLIFLVMGVPALLGRNIGEEMALAEAQDFAKGCNASRRACVRLLQNGRLIGEDYVIESSPTHIAFMDIALQRARVLLRGDLELQATRLPAAR